MIRRHPIMQRRWQQQHLIPINRDEVLSHHRSVLKTPDDHTGVFPTATPQGDSGLPRGMRRAPDRNFPVRYVVAAGMNDSHPSHGGTASQPPLTAALHRQRPGERLPLSEAEGHAGSTRLPTRSRCSVAATFGAGRIQRCDAAVDADAASPKQEATPTWLGRMRGAVLGPRRGRFLFGAAAIAVGR